MLVKYADQNDLTQDATVTKYHKLYVTPVRSDPSYFLQETQNSDGYFTIGDTAVRLASHDYEVKNFTLIGQTYDSITFSRKNSL